MVDKNAHYLMNKDGVFYFTRHVPNDVQKHYERPVGAGGDWGAMPPTPIFWGIAISPPAFFFYNHHCS